MVVKTRFSTLQHALNGLSMLSIVLKGLLISPFCMVQGGGTGVERIERVETSGSVLNKYVHTLKPEKACFHWCFSIKPTIFFLKCEYERKLRCVILRYNPLQAGFHWFQACFHVFYM